MKAWMLAKMLACMLVTVLRPERCTVSAAADRCPYRHDMSSCQRQTLLVNCLTLVPPACHKRIVTVAQQVGKVGQLLL